MAASAFNVKNMSSGIRLIQVVSPSGGKTNVRKQVPVGPGQEKRLMLDSDVAAKYMSAAARNEKYLKITPADDAARAAVSGRDTTETVGDNSSEVRKELLSRADGMDVEALRAEAKLVVGQRWPRRGGSDLTRDQIKDLLKE